MAALVLIAAGSLVYAGSVTSTVTTTTTTTTTTATSTSTETTTTSVPVTQTVTSQTTSTRLVTQTVTAAPVPNVVNLDVVPDWGGAGFDAFVVPALVGAAPPNATASSAGPVANDNITVSAGVAVTFVITNTDTAVLENFSGAATTPISIYNDTNAGQVALQYTAGQSILSLPISHTFTISQLGINIPIPPDTIVRFTYTFTNPGVYEYLCMTPCGPGMVVPGYMIGYVIVK